MNYNEIKAILKNRLNEQRYYHSLCVADEARRLAIKYGADNEKAYLAGLVHDITKNTPENEQLKIFSDFGIMPDDITLASKKLWHAVSGAAYIENVLNIKDAELLHAVRYHTTALGNMSLFDAVLYLADFTSADRDYDDVAVMRKLVDESLNDALKYALSYTICELVQKGARIHPDTFEAYNKAVNKELLF